MTNSLSYVANWMLQIVFGVYKVNYLIFILYFKWAAFREVLEAQRHCAFETVATVPDSSVGISRSRACRLHCIW